MRIRAALLTSRPRRTRLLEPRSGHLRLLRHALALGLTALSCALTPKRLPELDRRFYYNLPTAQDQSAFLELRKTEDRQAFLQKTGLWDQWLSLSEKERDAAVRGDVQIGFRAFALTMAWGLPADTKVREEPNRRIEFHTFIRCTSGPKIGEYVRNNLDCDGTSSETLVAVENEVVTEIKYVN